VAKGEKNAGGCMTIKELLQSERDIRIIDKVTGIELFFDPYFRQWKIRRHGIVKIYRSLSKTCEQFNKQITDQEDV
jgi:hypothetical protein